MVLSLLSNFIVRNRSLQLCLFVCKELHVEECQMAVADGRNCHLGTLLNYAKPENKSVSSTVSEHIYGIFKTIFI